MDSSLTNIFPSSSSTIASDVDALFNFIFYASAVFFSIVVGLSILFVIRYRRRGDEPATSQVAHNNLLEIVWTVIPTILVLIVFFWGFKDYVRLYVVPHDALEIKVTAQKWFWSFDYAEGASSVNELVVPVGHPIKLLMSSKDVIHSFAVPQFRIKMDVLPNRYTVAWFEAVDTGSYNIFCTEYCGKGHSEMLGTIRVLPAEESAAWIEANSNMGKGLSLEEFGAMLYKKKACVTCHSIDGSKNTGPTFKGTFGSQEKLKDGSSVIVDENYIRESLLNPKAKVVEGYEPVMPTYQGILKDRQVDALIEYIKTLK
ncbi:MAG: cytochrome c oxidase subunit II [bacterium]|nr:cytochrome c oxidase subunit II [bacterium]